MIFHARKIIFFSEMIRGVDAESDDVPLPDATTLYGMQATLTKYKNVFKILFMNYNYIPESKTKFWNDWQIRYPMAIAVLLIIICPYIDFILYTIHVLDLHFWAILKITIMMILYVMSYLNCIYQGPGYLPYYYPFKNSNRPNNKNDILKGASANEKQKYYAMKAGEIDRCHYFKSVGRYVLRPDHFCVWTTTFIGRKNHKLFFLFNFWGVVYIGSLFYYEFKAQKYYLFESNDYNPSHITILMFFLAYGVAFFILQVMFSFVCLKNFALNETQYEQVKYIEPPKYSRNLISNFEEVFGPRSKFYMWLIPTGAFHGMKTEDLLYKNHYLC